MNTNDHNRLLDILTAPPTEFPTPAHCQALGDQCIADWYATGDHTYVFAAEAARMLSELQPMQQAGIDHSPILVQAHRLLALAR